ncbi:hypothetical protein Tco_1374349, partial [Tanacetum coccineum]
IKRALTRKAFDDFCTKYHIPEEVYPILPNQNDTMHERPAGKIGLHFRINISQLSVIGAAKVFHFEILCHIYGVIPTVGLFRCFYVNSKKNGWMSFSKRSDNALVYMDIFAFIHTPDPTKVKIVERERNEDEPLLLQTTIGRTVPLLPVAPGRAESELETSVDKLFDKGGSGNQTEHGGSAGSGRGADIQLVSEATNTIAEDVAPLQPTRQRKRKTLVVGAGEASHPPKKLREDHGTLSEPFIAGKSRSAVQRLLVGAVLNDDVRGEAIPTLPFVTSFVSTTPEREGGDHTDSVVGPNLRTISAPQRFVIYSDFSHHYGANVAKVEVDSLVRSSVPVMTVVTTFTLTVGPALVVKEKPIKPYLFSADSSLVGRADPNTGVFSDLSGSDFLVGGIRIMVDEFAPPKFFASVREMEHDQLFTEFNVRAACQISLSAKVRTHAEYNVQERRRLKSIVEKQDGLLKVKEGEIENMKAQLLLREAEAAKAIRLRAEASNFEAVEKSLRDEATDLKASVIGKERELTGLNAQLTSVKSHNDTLVDRVHELELSSSELQEKVTVYENYMEQLEKF